MLVTVDLESAAVAISVLGKEHVTAAIELWQTCGLTRPWNDAETDLRRALGGPSSTVLGASDGTGLMGTGLMGTVMVGHDGHRGWIYYLAVAPAHRRQGVARLLMAAAEDWLTVREIPKVQLMVRRENNDVVGFYESIGYVASDVVVFGRRLPE